MVNSNKTYLIEIMFLYLIIKSFIEIDNNNIVGGIVIKKYLGTKSVTQSINNDTNEDNVQNNTINLLCVCFFENKLYKNIPDKRGETYLVKGK